MTDAPLTTKAAHLLDLSCFFRRSIWLTIRILRKTQTRLLKKIHFVSFSCCEVSKSDMRWVVEEEVPTFLQLGISRNTECAALQQLACAGVLCLHEVGKKRLITLRKKEKKTYYLFPLV